MADLRLDAGTLASIASQVQGGSDALVWNLHRAGFGVLGDDGVADAADDAFQRQKVRTSVLEASVNTAAAYPAHVADRFDDTDSRLARSMQ